jgi:hypothetical protein
MIRMDAHTLVPSAEEASADDAAMARAIERLAATGRRSTAEMLSELRREFPNSPLSVRIRALEMLRRRR